MPREVNIPAETVYEEIQSLQEFPEDQLVRVVVGVTDVNGTFLVPQQFKVYEIYGANYVELNSANPSWDPAKPAGTYFNDDLWHFIDILRNTNA
jgi:hypothetical protein